jgi:hypothetical protein
MKLNIFARKLEFKVGYYKMWSVGQYPTGVTKYCFDLFGTTFMFIRKGVH